MIWRKYEEHKYQGTCYSEEIKKLFARLKLFYLPPANEVWSKVMFLHLCAILFREGVCLQGGLHPGGVGQIPPIRYYRIWSTSGWYASYWNAFLFSKFSECSTSKACSHQPKTNEKAKKIKEQSEEIKEKISNIKENFHFCVLVSLGVNGPLV